MICAAIDIMGVCLSSQNIINSMESMIKVTRRSIAFTYLSSEDYKKAKLILRMRKEIRFSASTLFVVKSTTVLMALSYVANYTVILIQTSDKI
jgi:anthranilate/para-aminobenzoate synthase component II